MKNNTWKIVRFGFAAATLIAALVSCNSHALIKEQDPKVVVIDPPPPPPPPPKVDTDDAGLPGTLFPTVSLTDLPDGEAPVTVTATQTATETATATTTDTGTTVVTTTTTTATKTQTVTQISDAAISTPDLGPDVPPPETLVCPTGLVRVHVRDLWSKGVTPTLGTLSAPPLSVIVIDPTGSWTKYGARLDGRTDIDGNPPCTYYSVCIPNTLKKIEIQAVGDNACPAGNPSGDFDITSVTSSKEFWIEYNGSSSTLATDYTQSPVPTGGSKFHLTSDYTTLTAKSCKVGTPPDETPPAGYTKVHFRWPWNDPTNPKTPYAGSACPVDLATKLGFVPPPYPSSLKVTGVGGCELTAVLEFQDGTCPWYYVMIPNSLWPTTGTAPSIVFRYPDESKGLFTNGIQLPARGTTNEFWIGYAGAPDNKSPPSATVCMDWSLQTNSYFIYTSNPGPGCAGSSVTVDPCAPPQPAGYHTVHFRYIWAGQKTFTMFPAISLMPKWIEMEVNSTSALKVICWREQDRPWFECPVPDSSFTTGATWRAVDKTHNPEWNTVAPRPFPTTPKDYWVRWYYGKPDIPRTVDPPNFMFFDYYPDGTNGDWSATGVWNDSMCAPKPPASPVTVGFGNGAWFPYKKTQYKYPYGGSLAYIYPNSATVQDLFNAFVWERYGLWKQNWVKYDADACGTGTARVNSDSTAPTVSEGQGYGIAIAAAMGDKDLVGKLWQFVRHYRSEAKYCSLMGWSWKGTSSCNAADAPGTDDSAFDGDVDIAIGLVFAALQWPNDFTDIAVSWLKGMECEINTKYGDGFNYPTNGDSWDKSSCTANKCDYGPATVNSTYVDYFPPGYFRVFGDFLAAKLGSTAQAGNGQTYHDFWYKTAETVWELVERCYDQSGVHPGLMGNMGNIKAPCSANPGGGPYEWGRSLWRLAIDAAWVGQDTSLPENKANSSPHYGPKSRIQAKMDNIQDFYTNFYKNNPPEPNANRFSKICDQLGTDGIVPGTGGCDPANGHNSYTVNMAMCPYVSLFNDGGTTTSPIRREAIEEAITTTIQNDRYFQESLGVYSILFLTGNFPNPMSYSQLP